MVEAALRASGYSTGLFTSPHLIDVRERVKINGWGGVGWGSGQRACGPVAQWGGAVDSLGRAGQGDTSIRLLVINHAGVGSTGPTPGGVCGAPGTSMHGYLHGWVLTGACATCAGRPPAGSS